MSSTPLAGSQSFRRTQANFSFIFFFRLHAHNIRPRTKSKNRSEQVRRHFFCHPTSLALLRGETAAAFVPLPHESLLVLSSNTYGVTQ